MDSKSIVIECSRQNSVDVNTFGVSSALSGNNATWTNLTNLQLNEGDKVGVQLATIHAIGADNQNTIEISGQADEDSELVDNKVLLQFSPYINNTGQNFVVCPYVGGNAMSQEYNPNYFDGVNDNLGIENYQVIPQKTFRNAPASEGGTATGKRATAIYGSPISNDDGAGLNNGYRFDPLRYDGTAVQKRPNLNPNTPSFVKSANLLEKVDGSRFVKVNKNYQGPFKTEDGTGFLSNDTTEAFFTEKYEVPIEISAPKYESPTVICNDINDILHRTTPQNNNTFTTEAEAFENHDDILPMTRFAGPLFQYYPANAQVPGSDNYQGANRFWGQIAVKDENKWYMVHNGMRLETIIPTFTPPGSATAYNVDYPCYWSSRYKALRDTAGHPEHNIWRYPAIRYEQYGGGKANPRQYRYYSTLPEYFMIATNIRWTQENANSLIEMFKKNEIYEGDKDSATDANSDNTEWYITLDAGRCDECNNTFDDGDANSRGHPLDEQYYDGWNGGAFGQKDKFNLLEKWVNWDEETLDALRPLRPYYQTKYAPAEQISIGQYELPVPCQKYKRNTFNQASNLRVGGAMERAGSFTVYSRFMNDWKEKAKLKNFPDTVAGNTIYGDGFATDDGQGNEIYDAFSDPNHNIDVGGYGLFPMKIYEPDNTHHIVFGFMIYNPTAYRDNTTQRWYVDNTEARANGYTGRTIRPCWAIPNLTYALASPSSMDNPYGLLINNNVMDNFNEGFSNGEDAVEPVGDKNIQYAGIPNDIRGFCNFVMLGANNPTCVFDSSLSRASFQNLHTVRKLGVDELIFKKDSTTDVIGVNLGDEAVVFNDKLFDMGHFNQLKYDGTKSGKPSESKVSNDTQSNGCFSDALSGLYLTKVYFQNEGQLVQSSSDTKAIEATEDNFYNTLLYKLGFRYEDLFPTFGLPNSRYNQSYQKDESRLNRYNAVKPITTNEDLTISAQPSLVLMDGSRSFSATGAGEPTFKLSLGSFNRFNISAPGSTQVLASRLPTRLDTSFYLVYSDLVISDYNQEETTLQVVALASKAYATGDFFISFGDNSFGEISNTKPHYVKSITTQIRYPNGKLANLSEKSSVIYRITKPSSQPTIQDILKKKQKRKESKRTSNEEILKELKKMNTNQEDMIDIMMETLNIKLEKKKKKK